MKRPPAHPTELACPCCLPALGELGEVPPHGGLARSLGEGSEQTKTGPRGRFHGAVRRPVASSAEVSPSGLWRSLGKRVGLIALGGSNPPTSATGLRGRVRSRVSKTTASALDPGHSISR